ncbi:hypothetical protein JW968_01400 [Candidatus Woesearchaeota archaeon]|nr:hypothetical protein [Candidatus Woesearchaeota archaeon]
MPSEMQQENAYDSLTALLRNITAARLKEGHYEFLCMPNTKCRNLHLPYKARTKFIARPEDITGTGERSLDIGRSEVIYVLSGQFRDPSDMFSGMKADGATKIRAVIGTTLVTREFAGMYLCLRRQSEPAIAYTLSRGRYDDFVRVMLSITNCALRYHNRMQQEGCRLEKMIGMNEA